LPTGPYSGRHFKAEGLFNAQAIGSNNNYQTCTLDHLGQSSAPGQAEVRWRAHKRLRFVAFVGTGWVGESFATSGEDESTPSYGTGIRFEVLPAKRHNMHLDHAWSVDS